MGGRKHVITHYPRPQIFLGNYLAPLLLTTATSSVFSPLSDFSSTRSITPGEKQCCKRFAASPHLKYILIKHDNNIVPEDIVKPPFCL